MTSRARFWLAIVSILLLPSFLLARTWTSRDGRRIEADFVDVDETTVTLKKLADGKEVKFKIELLDDVDQAFLLGILARRATRGGTPTPESPADSPFETVGSADDKPATKPEKDDDASDVPDWLREGDEPGSASGAKKKMKPESRTWTDRQGNKITGKFVRILGSDVFILRSGRQVSSDYWQLSQTDKDYLKELLESNGQGRLIPTLDPATVAANPTTSSTSVYPSGGYPTTPNTSDGRDPIARLRELEAQGKVTIVGGGFGGSSSSSSTTPSPSYTAPSYPTPSYGTTYPSTTPAPYTTPGYSSATAPAYTPPTTTYTPSPTPAYNPPAIPTYTPPSPMFVTQKQCMRCGAVVPDNLTAGDSCPKCGVFFATDATTGRTSAAGPGFRLPSLRIGWITGIVSGGILFVTAIAFCAWLVTGRKG